MDSVMYLKIFGFAKSLVTVRVGNPIVDIIELFEGYTEYTLIGTIFKIRGIGYLRVKKVSVRTIFNDEVIFMCDWIGAIGEEVSI